MKKTGIVGGIGPASTLDYYKDIIEGYRRRTGLDEYPPIVIDSINMTAMINALSDNDYEEVANQMLRSINNLAAAGADFVAIASNTPHIVIDEVLKKSIRPIISIVEENCNYALEKNYNKVVVIGTKFTMSSGLYNEPLKKQGIEAIVPDEEDIEAIHKLIFPNLEAGIVIQEDKIKMIQISEKYIAKYNADALLLGCTEIPLMIKEGDVSVPIISTTQVHIDAIVKELLKA